MDVEVLQMLSKLIAVGNIYPVDSFDVYDDEGNKNI